MILQRIEQFHATRLGHLVFGLLELVLAYGLVLKALDTGNLIIWTVTIILLVGFLQNMARMVAPVRRVKHVKTR